MRLRPSVASALQAGAVIAAVAALGLAAQQPWLFPSLAPTAVMQAQPRPQPTARPWNAVVGHLCGVLFGWLGVILVGAQHAPAVMSSGHLTGVRLAAATIAIALTALSSELLSARHAPAASTTLLFAEGSYRPTGHDVLLVIAGVALTVAMGEVLHRMRPHGTQRARWPRLPIPPAAPPLAPTPSSGASPTGPGALSSSPSR